MGSTLTTVIPDAIQQIQIKAHSKLTLDRSSQDIDEDSSAYTKKRLSCLKPCLHVARRLPIKKKLNLVNWSRTALHETSSPSFLITDTKPVHRSVDNVNLQKEYLLNSPTDNYCITFDANSNLEHVYCRRNIISMYASISDLTYIDEVETSEDHCHSGQKYNGHLFIPQACHRLSDMLQSPDINICLRHSEFGIRPAPSSMYDLHNTNWCHQRLQETKMVTVGTQTVLSLNGKLNRKAGSLPPYANRLTHPSVQASTTELLRCFGVYLHRKCRHLKSFQPRDLSLWLQRVDQTLLVQGWQDFTFINPANLIFMFMLTRDAVPATLNSELELQRVVLTCFYLSYAYMGNEISYPLKPFLVDADREKFWTRCLHLINMYSSDMLKINNCPDFFGEMILELTTHGSSYDFT